MFLQEVMHTICCGLLCKIYISAENSLYYIKNFLFQYLNTSDDSEFTDRHGCNWGANSPENFFAPLEKCVGQSLQLLDIV